MMESRSITLTGVDFDPQRCKLVAVQKPFVLVNGAKYEVSAEDWDEVRLYDGSFWACEHVIANIIQQLTHGHVRLRSFFDTQRGQVRFMLTTREKPDSKEIMVDYENIVPAFQSLWAPRIPQPVRLRHLVSI